MAKQKKGSLKATRAHHVIGAALLWTAVYTCLAAYWTVSGKGFPFGLENDPNASISFLKDVTVRSAAPVLLAIGCAALAVGALMLRKRRIHAVLSGTLIVFAVILSIVLLVGIPDYRALVAVGYAPIFLLGLPFGWPDARFSAVIPWPVLNQMLCIVGGGLWGWVSLLYARRRRNACMHCGRSAKKARGWTSPASAKVWGTWAVAIAFVIPTFYAVTRWSWALGIPLGIPDDFLREGQEAGMWYAGAALATLAFGGALLTIGLVRPWGEVFPRWTLFLKGKRVPLAAAIVPASFVAILVTGAGLMFVRLILDGSFPYLSEGWGTVLPELFWPVWGLALGAAALAYYYRRRGVCRYCGRGS